MMVRDTYYSLELLLKDSQGRNRVVDVDYCEKYI